MIFTKCLLTPHFSAGLMEVIIYSSPDDKKKNRGFCFLEYESHKAASLAKRRLGTGRIKVQLITLRSPNYHNYSVFSFPKLFFFLANQYEQVWSCDIIVDWADPQEEPDEGTMSKVKVLYVRNLTQDISEEKLKVKVVTIGKFRGADCVHLQEQFEQYGKVERVKKIKDYAFVHFEDRDNAVLAMRDLDGKDVGGSNIEVSVVDFSPLFFSFFSLTYCIILC